MILKGFKERSNKKYLNKILSTRNINVNDKKINSLGVIMHIDESDDFEIFRTLAADLNIHPNKLKIIAYSNIIKEDYNSWEMCFNAEDFGWGGTIKNVELRTFLDTQFDALISYYSSDELKLKMLTAMSQSAFKIGVLQTDNRLNDLIIKSNLSEFSVFKNELFKYLTVLKKIKNEQ